MITGSGEDRISFRKILGNVKYYVKILSKRFIYEWHHRILSATDLGTHWNLLSEIPTYLWKYPSYAPVSQSSYTLRYTLALLDSQYINTFTIRTLMIHCEFIHRTELIKWFKHLPKSTFYYTFSLKHLHEVHVEYKFFTRMFYISIGSCLH